MHYAQGVLISPQKHIAAPIKSEDKILRKCSEKKRDEIRAQRHPQMHGIAPFFFKNFPEPPLPLQRSLAPSKVNFAAPIEIRWLRL